MVSTLSLFFKYADLALQLAAQGMNTRSLVRRLGDMYGLARELLWTHNSGVLHVPFHMPFTVVV